MYSPRIAEELRKRGHDAISVKERPDLVGRSDREVFAAMASEGRAIVTNNAADFTPLFIEAIAFEEQHAGLLLTSDRSLPRRREGIGRFVDVLDLLFHSNEGRDAIDEVRWLP